MTPADRPKSRLAPAMIVAGIICAMLPAGYVGGYLLTCKATSVAVRTTPSSWWASFYEPAASVESKIIGQHVYLMYPPPGL